MIKVTELQLSRPDPIRPPSLAGRPRMTAAQRAERDAKHRERVAAARAKVGTYASAKLAAITAWTREYLCSVFEATGGNITLAAEVIDMGRPYLKALMKQYGVAASVRASARLKEPKP